MFLSLCTALSLWFSLSIYGWGSQNPINYFFSFALVNVFALAAFPVFYEAIVENTYPVSEGVNSVAIYLSMPEYVNVLHRIIYSE